MLFMTLFSNTVYSGTTINVYGNFSCANATHLQVDTDTATYVRGCAWGCVEGECLDGIELSISAFLVLIVCWGIGFLIIYIGFMIERDDLIKTITLIIGLLFFVIGIISALGIYSVSTNIGETISNLLFGIATSVPLAIILLGLLGIVIIVISRVFASWESRGGFKS